MEGMLISLFNASAQRLTRTHFGTTLLLTEVKDRKSTIADISLLVYHIRTSTGK